MTANVKKSNVSCSYRRAERSHRESRRCRRAVRKARRSETNGQTCTRIQIRSNIQHQQDPRSMDLLDLGSWQTGLVDGSFGSWTRNRTGWRWIFWILDIVLEKKLMDPMDLGSCKEMVPMDLVDLGSCANQH